MDSSVRDGVKPVPASNPDTAPASAGAPGASLAKWQFRPGQSGNTICRVALFVKDEPGFLR